MLCCLFTALLSGNIAFASHIAAGLARGRSAGKLVALAALSLAGALLASAAIAHVGHYAERASLNDRTILEEVLAAPICSGLMQHGTER